MPTEEEALQGKLEPWLEFRQLYRKSDVQHFNDSESSKVKIAFNGLAEAVFRAADVLIATAGKTELPKNTTFQQIVMDKISVATHGELLCCWGGTETLTIIEDGKQLPATVLTTTAQNLFCQRPELWSFSALLFTWGANFPPKPVDENDRWIESNLEQNILRLEADLRSPKFQKQLS